jgi:Domain of Unknown Function (DUF928)
LFLSLLFFICQVYSMVKLKAGLSIGLMSMIVVLEIVGVIQLPQPFSPDHAAMAQTRRPYRRAAGGKRGICLTSPQQLSEELMAFLPAGKAVDRTTTNAPTLYFYVPEQSEQVANLEFRLDYADEAKRGNGVINPPLSVPIGKTPGVVAVTVPAVLVRDVTYAWSLTLRCQGNRGTVSFKGLMVYQDLPPSVATQVAQASTAPQKAQIYMQSGFSLDAVPLLMENSQLQAQTFEAMIAETGFVMPVDKTDPSH